MKSNKRAALSVAQAEPPGKIVFEDQPIVGRLKSPRRDS
jgi:hypothetical protein